MPQRPTLELVRDRKTRSKDTVRLASPAAKSAVMDLLDVIECAERGVDALR